MTSKKMQKAPKSQDPEALKSLTTLDGLMTIVENNMQQHVMDFSCCEDVEMIPFTAQCKVQVMRDGNVYITEKKRRKPNHPIFREDNSSLTLGHDGVYYFHFALPQERVEELPEKLAHQALVIAQKVVNEILYANAEEVTL